ncbi:hypothetical protein ACFQ6C_26040 [Streptomyces sp. NPDC056454]|uniref:hypothetical protein n=1 Tax=Streptomyces sp. NPDC056454 TaxID=3345823 RepID=UPI0036C883A9
MAAPKSDPAPGSLASKMVKLIDLDKNPRTGESYTQLEIAEECSRLCVEDKISRIPLPAPGDTDAEEAYRQAVTDVRSERPLLNRQYVSDLCTGRRDNPTRQVIEYLARLFGVNPAYFFSGSDETPETRATVKEVELMEAVRDLKTHLEQGGQEDGGRVLAQLFRGGTDLTPDTAMALLKMQLAAMQSVKKEDQ